MNIRSTFICGLLLISGCREVTVPEKEEIETSPRLHLERTIKKQGEVTFYGWNGMQHNSGAHFRMSFLKGSNVKLDILGSNFVFVSGSYSFIDGDVIKITFNKFDTPDDTKSGYTTGWPLLRLSEDEGELRISRDDDKTAWHINWPLYPEIVEDLWPIRTLDDNAEQEAAGQSTTAE